MPLQGREEAVAAREASAARAAAAMMEQQESAAQELARLDAAIHESLGQLRDIEADYLTGTQQVGQMHQEVGVGVGRRRETGLGRRGRPYWP